RGNYKTVDAGLFQQLAQPLDRLAERALLLAHVGPDVAGLLDARRHVAERERAGRHVAADHFIPRARRRHRRAGLRTDRVRRGEGRAVVVASGVDEDAAGAIALVELQRELLRIARHEQLRDAVREARGL